MKNNFELLLNGAYLELTSVCNASCPYCYNNSNCNNKDELPVDVVKRIIDEIADSRFPAIVFSGGEPFLYTHIFEVVEYALCKNVKPTIITNGSLLTKQQIDMLLKKDLSIQLTFDSTIPTEHDANRGDGNFQKLLEILSYAHLNKSEDKLMIRYNVSKINYDRVDDFIDLLSSYGVKAATFSFLHKAGRGKHYLQVFDFYKDCVLLGHVINTFYKKQKELKQSKSFKLEFGELDHLLGCAYFANGEIKSTPRIDSKGDVYPCQIFAGLENSLGNVLNHTSLNDILHSSKCIKVIEQIRHRKNKIINNCCKCPYDEFCMGGCPATAYNNTGNLCMIDSQCYFIKYSMKNKANYTKADTFIEERTDDNCII